MIRRVFLIGMALAVVLTISVAVAFADRPAPVAATDDTSASERDDGPNYGPGGKYGKGGPNAMLRARGKGVGKGQGNGFGRGRFGPGPHGDAFLDDLAAELGISRARLDGAMRNVVAKRVDAAAADGRLTAEQAERLRECLADDSCPPGWLKRPWREADEDD